MPPVDADQLASALLGTPVWARVGLTVRDGRMRERAAKEIAEALLQRLENAVPPPHRDQMLLPL